VLYCCAIVHKALQRKTRLPWASLSGEECFSGFLYHFVTEPVSFFLKDKTPIKQVIHVSYDIENKNTKERERRSILKAMNEFTLKEGIDHHRQL